jgi:hypothetical protein
LRWLAVVLVNTFCEFITVAEIVIMFLIDFRIHSIYRLNTVGLLR